MGSGGWILGGWILGGFILGGWILIALAPDGASDGFLCDGGVE
jgi:hypothetical protein